MAKSRTKLGIINPTGIIERAITPTSLLWDTAQVIPVFCTPFVVEIRKIRKNVLVVEIVMELEVETFDILERRDDLRRRSGTL